ncbi:oxygenase MpaB family protein [Cyclobacterium jeungdonense]|uniref:Oxygenase MpaB family protein n=1 Tax=Cyclobacterium jeungdonense TaxID=708087 RepID=A0ABT8C9C0_9BACT|nr:oxygenase MpaB family protein [Cyclobacterium jeungdonense]MDN3689105.1 oxygenase MpaB family protein [Cyclobacterium jeungdonense]
MDLYTNGNLDQLRKRLDAPADAAAADLIQDPQLVSIINSWNIIPETIPETFPDTLRSFFQIFLQPPPLVDPHQIRRTQGFFEINAALILSLLGFYSLPYTYAFADGAEVLVRSKKILDNPGKRLSETALFVLECYRPDAFLGDKNVLLVLAKVRLIHALSRIFIDKYARDWNPGWGKPINQEDMLATNLTFSLLVSRGMERSGVSVSKEQRDGLLQYWALVGYYMGIDPAFLPHTSKEAFELERLIRKRHLKSSPAGKKLVKSLLRFYQQELIRPELAPFMEAILAFYMGGEMSQVLGIHKASLIPDWVFRSLSNSGLFSVGSGPSRFSLLYQQFVIQSKKSLGTAVSISLPSLQ